METYLWYSILFGSLVIYSLLVAYLSIRWSKTLFYYKKYLQYPQVHRYLRGTAKFTGSDMALVLMAWIVNALCVGVGVKDRTGVMKRSGLMATANMIPLAFGSQVAFIADLFGIEPELYRRAHNWIGRILIAEGVLHAVLATTLVENWYRDVGSLLVLVVLSAIALGSVPFVQTHFYEIFARCHFMLVVTLMIVAWKHLAPSSPLKPPKLYLLLSSCLWASNQLLRYVYMVYRNIKYRSPRTFVSSANIKPMEGAVLVEITPARTWKFEAGQFVYLRLPGVSRTAFVEVHPFFVMWWSRDKFELLIESQRGLTASLQHYAQELGSKKSNTMAIIDGPYGKKVDLTRFETVMLFATGIGIAGQLSYLKSLMNIKDKRATSIKRITLFWEIEHLGHLQWVTQKLDSLLEKDVSYILKIELYVRQSRISETINIGDHELLHVNYQDMDPKSLIEGEISRSKGQMVVSLCVCHQVAETIRRTVTENMDIGVRLVELDFRPT
ncbi:hypothetical protein K469DRAFT_589592 [Zopfia rhizophila CBS 207.26]|uniref:FAD-binding FR-type domain-containing protein n=1 Tax=Zopfia rhizophila CBS 207.26 TaxID=1314779 RepID=A0A6A6DST8_9PEZI|nr:hypothetical protein K469DRAFT_589592 [Zopfia rhizophila CBS 207.26]